MSLSFVVALVTDLVFSVNQYPRPLYATIRAKHSGTPSFIRLRNLILGFFHCFQMYVRILRRSHSSHSCILCFMVLSRSNWATLSCSVWLRPWPCGHSVPGSASSVHAICSLLSALPSLTRGKRIVSIELLLLCLAFNPNKFYAKTSVGRLQSHLFEKIVSWVWQGIGWGAWLWKVPCGFVAFFACK